MALSLPKIRKILKQNFFIQVKLVQISETQSEV